MFETGALLHGAPLSVTPREDQLWPALTQAQMARIEKQGRRRPVQPGDVLIDAGQTEFPFRRTK